LRKRVRCKAERSWQRAAILLALLLAGLLGGAGLLTGGCTSERSNIVGAGLPQTRFDSLLVPVRVEQLAGHGNVSVTDPNLPYADYQLLYFGRQGTEESSILAHYDFAAFADTFSQAVVDTANIKSFRLFLYLISFYQNELAADSTKISKYYEILEVTEPFTSEQFPGPSPAVDPNRLNPDLVLADANAILFFYLNKQKFVDWYEDPASHQGLLVREADIPGNDPGLLGFAATGFGFAGSLIDPDLAGTLVGPALNVEFRDPPNTFARLLPTVDLSTLERLDPIPPDFTESFTLRTHLRSYPYLAFDIDLLPPAVFIERAVLGVVNDTTRSYGPLQSIVVSEIGADFASVPEDTVTLDELQAAADRVTGRTNIDPVTETRLEFNVTSTVQRAINGAFAGPARLLLTGGESFFPAEDLGPNPDFYLMRYVFHGTGAADSLRPYLKIVYSRAEDLTGGAP
jgi:hypothetical protein